jgi:gluconate 2-dehydrogenase gamma chain
VKKQKGTSRRSMLMTSATGLSSAWLAAHWPQILAAQQQARQVARSGGGKLEFLTPDQAVEIDAMASQIIPTDSTPGAKEAGSVHFIDRALASFDRGQQAVYTKGLDDLQAKARQLGKDQFSALSSAQQIEVLKGIEKTPFFNAVRVHTIIGFFANPEYGGNDGKVGWKLIGFEDKFDFKPPFGSYDRDAHRA